MMPMKYSFKVNMISGEYARKRVEEAIAAIDGVKTVTVDLGTGNVTVESPEDIGLDVFAAAVEEAGYRFAWDSEGK